MKGLHTYAYAYISGNLESYGIDVVHIARTASTANAYLCSMLCSTHHVCTPPLSAPSTNSTRRPQGRLSWQMHCCFRASLQTQETWFVFGIRTSSILTAKLLPMPLVRVIGYSSCSHFVIRTLGSRSNPILYHCVWRDSYTWLIRTVH